MFEIEAEKRTKNCQEAYNSGFSDGYAVGLKAGKDMREDPKEDSRPRTFGYYLTASRHKAYKGFVFEVAYFTGTIFTKGGQIGDDVVAWKEIVPPELKESK